MPLHAAVALVPAGEAEHKTQYNLPLTFPSGCSLDGLFCVVLHQGMEGTLTGHEAREGEGEPVMTLSVREAAAGRATVFCLSNHDVWQQETWHQSLASILGPL